MPAEELVRACLNELRGLDHLDTARDMAKVNRSALLGTRGVASGLVSGAADGEDGDQERCLELFEGLIGEEPCICAFVFTIDRYVNSTIVQ